MPAPARGDLNGTPTPRAPIGTSITPRANRGGLDSPFRHTPQPHPHRTPLSRSSQETTPVQSQSFPAAPRTVETLRYGDRSDGEGYRSDRSSREGSTSGREGSTSGTDEVFGTGSGMARTGFQVAEGFVGTNGRKTLSTNHNFTVPYKQPAVRPTHQATSSSTSQRQQDDSVTPRPPTRVQPAGQMQRQFGQLFTSLQTTQNKLVTQVANMEQEIRRLTQSGAAKEATIQKQNGLLQDAMQQLERQNLRLTELEAQVRRGGMDDREEESDLSKDVRKVVTLAVVVAYGCTPPVGYPTDTEPWPRLKTASGADDGHEAMRWDFDQPLSSERNEIQTSKLQTILEYHLDSLPITADMVRETLPAFKDNKNIYSSAISARFKLLQQAWKRKKLKRRAPSVDVEQRAALEEEIKALEDRDSQGPPEVLRTLSEKKAQLKSLERVGKPERSSAGYSKTGVRSKLTVMQKWVKAKRALIPEFQGEEWACMETIYALIPPVSSTPDGEGKKLWHWPMQDTVYSQEFLTAFFKIYNCKNSGGSKISGTAIHPLSEAPNFTPPDAMPYLPADYEFLWEAPQRWMFTDEWLDDHPDLPIVPCDVPTDPEQVKTSMWYKTHAWSISKPGGKKNTQAGGDRARSQSTVPSTSASTPRDQAISDSEHERGHPSNPENPAKRRKVGIPPGLPHVEEGNESGAHSEDDIEFPRAPSSQYPGRADVPGLSVTPRAGPSRQPSDSRNPYDQDSQLPTNNRSVRWDLQDDQVSINNDYFPNLNSQRPNETQDDTYLGTDVVSGPQELDFDTMFPGVDWGAFGVGGLGTQDNDKTQPDDETQLGGETLPATFPTESIMFS
ncbi:hypothetical protein HD553DRAFT_342095 [Filobasidium floriforme]|uniref:uncharacterized protein n=1 Tax=Filobasidium floriforme TaxID=5210 RepID=UPI001E8E6372|nr:uncharacterized protein HD553DRAFT_342095 [Filobasidium floriforme]KAH8084602.1 hypothetical protein HD553DRAFT_342095 [Filobasidium floriforme]